MEKKRSAQNDGTDRSLFNGFKYSDITGKVIPCAMNVHGILGNGFPEVFYQRAMEYEMIEAGLSFQREFEMPVHYKDHHIGTRRVDFFIEGVVSLEMKAVLELESKWLGQAINYLEAYNIEVGLLINFGSPHLQFKRLLNRKYKDPDLSSADTSTNN